jgi:hypothetical protein
VSFSLPENSRAAAADDGCGFISVILYLYHFFSFNTPEKTFILRYVQPSVAAAATSEAQEKEVDV